jgi:hypothetical protein
MLEQTLPNITCSHANNCILTRVVGGRAAKELNADETFLEQLEVTGQGLLHNVFEKLPAAVAPFECRTLDYVSQVSAKRGNILFRFSNLRNFGFPRIDWLDGLHSGSSGASQIKVFE